MLRMHTDKKKRFIFLPLFLFVMEVKTLLYLKMYPRRDYEEVICGKSYKIYIF